MSKKGMVGLVSFIIGAVIAVILLANFLLPIVRSSTSETRAYEAVVHNTDPVQQNVTLSKAGENLVSGSLTLGNLTLGANYTINYTTGVITFNASNALNGTYFADYDYYAAGYVSNTSERTMLALVLLAAFIGVVFMVFNGFGLMKD